MTFDLGEINAIDHSELEPLVARLEASGGYRVLRRILPRTHVHVSDGTPTERGIFLDVETTGLDPATEEVIELAMVPFDFTSDGRVT
jgi:DNA polymerase-3 subunit epsilon